MRYIVLHPKIAKESAEALATALNCPFENPYETKNRLYSKRDYDLVINYGCSVKTKGVKKLNKANAVKNSKSKTETFALLKDKVPLPVTTDSFEEASQWIKQKRTVVVRDIEDGNNGKGIHFITTQKALNKYKEAPLFTRYIVHKTEWRINVFQGKILSVYEKIHNKGFFKFNLTQNLENHQPFIDIAKAVYENIGLDWCGIDVIETHKGNYFILEVNSAPVLFPYTIKKLVKEIHKYANENI